MWLREERRLIQVLERRVFRSPSDLAALLPPDMADPFTAPDPAEVAGMRARLAQKQVYSLRRMGVLRVAGQRGRAILYSREGFRQDRGLTEK